MLAKGTVPSVFVCTTSKCRKPKAKKCETSKNHKQKAKKRRAIKEPNPLELQAPEEMRPVPETVWLDHDYSSRDPGDKLAAAQAHIAVLERKCRFCLERFSTDCKLIKFYTGFVDYDILCYGFRLLEPNTDNLIRWGQVQRSKAHVENNTPGDVFRDSTLPLIDQFFMFLTRIRLGLFEEDLAVRFCVSKSTVTRVILTWTNYLYFMLGRLALWPDKKKTKENVPESVKKIYPNIRVILDCTEIKTQTPNSKVLKGDLFSNYKSFTTFKGLIGISPWGSVIFVSKLYTESMSDKTITCDSGVLDLLEPGDEVMADKDFLIADLLADVQASLVPPFHGKRGQFAADLVELRHLISQAIRRVKENHIWDTVLPLSLAGLANQLWTVCAILTNFQGPLIK